MCRQRPVTPGRQQNPRPRIFNERVLARKVETPYPIVMVVGGLLLGFLPGIPKITLNPDLIFLFIFPPLLYGILQRQTYGFRNFQNYRLRVRVMCS